MTRSTFSDHSAPSKGRPLIRPLGRTVQEPPGTTALRWVGALIIGIAVMGVLETARSGETGAVDVVSMILLVACMTWVDRIANQIPDLGTRISFGVVATIVLVAAGALLIALLPVDVAALPLAVGFASGVLVAGLAALPGLASRAATPVRILVLGSGRAAKGLRRELELAQIETFEVVGWVDARPSVESVEDTTTPLGSLVDLASIVRREQVDLLVMSGDASRIAVFDEVARSCLDLPVRFCELAGFHEDLFGHVPVTEINTAWFQYIMHPRYGGGTPLAKRGFDVVMALLIGLLFAPVIGIAMLIIRRDGDPALFKQPRVGDGGRPFTLYKLRTMSQSGEDVAAWAEESDPRITPIGKWLRRTHIDELPQLYNVLRGDMSMVGPRPEQLGFVEMLERDLPFYQRRHLIKPGLTGWAQVRCGYAGSDRGSLWKLSHDLYYLKHRSMNLDIAILWSTVGEILLPRPHAVDADAVGWVFDESASEIGNGKMPSVVQGELSAG